LEVEYTGTVSGLTTTSNGDKFFVATTDSLVSMWDTREFMCEKTFTNYQNLISITGISHDDKLLAVSTNDKIIDIAHIESTESVATIKCDEVVDALAWHPKELLLVYTEDLSRQSTREAEQFIKVWKKS